MIKQPDSITELLCSETKGIGETKGVGGILADIWRIVMRDINLNPTRFEFLCNQYVIKARRGLTDARVANYFNRGNLRRELAKNTMSFKTFIKALKVLDIVKVEFAFKLHHRSGKTTIHEHIVDIANIHDINPEEESNDEK